MESIEGVILNLEHLNIFLRIVERGSLAGAARACSLSATTVSERLAALEDYYGAPLFHRTTRALHLTEAGRTLLEGAPRLLAEADELRSHIRLGIESLAGPLRISAPIDLGRQRIAPILDGFLAANAGVTAELLLSDQYIDLMAESVDIAVRFGSLPDSTLRVRHVGRKRRVVCASPEYLRIHGAPEMPADLLEHNCLCMRFGARVDDEWRFQESGDELTIQVVGDRAANDGALIREWCVMGRGIAMKSEWDVSDDLKAGRLVEILAEFAAPASALQLVFRPGRSHPRRVEAFADALVMGLQSV